MAVSIRRIYIPLLAVRFAVLTLLATPCFASGASGATLFFNGRIFTGEPERPYADAIAVRGDRIIAVGTLSTIAASVGSGAKRIDLGGKFLMPGMVDGCAWAQANWRTSCW